MPQPTDAARLGACGYILHMLLQRVEQQQPGLLDELIRGVTADRDSVQAQAVGNAQSDDVFAEALRMLSLANDQRKLQSQP
ncbi:hypothetical protein J5T34_08005 [Cupriavidus gilardii]|nr:hypothetical protein [Cupriavidus gilardii]